MERQILIEKSFDKDVETAVYEREGRSILSFWGIKDNNLTSYSIMEGTSIVFRFCFRELYEDLYGPNEKMQLQTIIIPSSVREIRNADLPHSVYNVVNYSSFFEIENKTLFSYNKRELIRCYDFFNDKEYKIPDSVECIRRDAFNGCGFYKIIIGPSVREMGENPFMNMEHLLGPTIVESRSDYFFTDGNGGIYSNKKELIDFVGEGEEYHVLDGTTAIQDYAFSGTSVRKIWLPSSIKGFNIDKYFPINNLLFIIPIDLKFDYSSYSLNIMDEITYRNKFKPKKYPGNY